MPWLKDEFHLTLGSIPTATYYINTVAVEPSIPLILLLNAATLLLCMAVLVGHSYLISHIHPARSMHYE